MLDIGVSIGCCCLMSAPQNTVSVHNPSYYSRRFYDFLQKVVFVKEKGSLLSSFSFIKSFPLFTTRIFSELWSPPSCLNTKLSMYIIIIFVLSEMVSHYHNLLISSSFSLSKNVFPHSISPCVCVCVYVAKARGRKASKLPGGVRRVVQTGGVVRTQSMPHSRDRFHSQQHQVWLSCLATTSVCWIELR